jgi:hypothetical protein
VSAIGQFRIDLHQELLSRASLDGEESLVSHAFASWAIDTLIEAGELEDATPCYFEAQGARISGFGADPEGRSIDLIAAVYSGSAESGTISPTEITTAFRRLSGFIEKCRTGLHLRVEAASPAFDAALTVHERFASATRVRLLVVTDKSASERRRTPTVEDGVETTYSVWDGERLSRLVSSGTGREPIEIDFTERYGAPLACLPPALDHPDYRAYLAVIPARVLADLYEEFGGRLLEQNVRAFLSTRVKVNKGIRATLANDPERFLAYNNGISAVAGEILIETTANGSPGIRVIRDLQIVNGGQTTASIHAAANVDRADVSRVDVQAKITVIGNPEEYSSIVRDISRYANTQNRISEADLAANDPFHVRLEELSRTVWAPAADGGQRMTRWFYERARASYEEALRRERTPALKAQFKRDHPTQQKFAKTDVAKYENTWEQLPHLVSMGAQKNFAHFTRRMAERKGFIADVAYFERLIAKAILFRRATRIATQLAFPAYRANVVTYSLAYLSHRTQDRVRLDSIWRSQAVPEEIDEALPPICQAVFDSITNPPGGGNIGEWCKKEPCWERVRALAIPLPASLADVLIDVGKPTNSTEVLTDEQAAELAAVSEQPSEVWFALARWAAETSNLQGWQRSLAFDIGKRLTAGRPPSAKQAHQGLLALGDAKRKGFAGIDS